MMAEVRLQYRRSRTSRTWRDSIAPQYGGTGFIRNEDGSPWCAWSILLQRREAKHMDGYQRGPGCKLKKSLSSASRQTQGAAGPRRMELPSGASARLSQEWTRGSTSAGTVPRSQFSTVVDGVMAADGIMAAHGLLWIGGGVSRDRGSRLMLMMIQQLIEKSGGDRYSRLIADEVERADADEAIPQRSLNTCSEQM
jgi:hypothetical protein